MSTRNQPDKKRLAKDEEAAPPKIPAWRKQSPILANIRTLRGVSFFDLEVLDEGTGEFVTKNDEDIAEDVEGWAALSPDEQQRAIGVTMLCVARLLDDNRRIALRNGALLKSAQRSRIVSDGNEDRAKRTRDAGSKRPVRKEDIDFNDDGPDDDNDDAEVSKLADAALKRGEIGPIALANVGEEDIDYNEDDGEAPAALADPNGLVAKLMAQVEAQKNGAAAPPSSTPPPDAEPGSPGTSDSAS